MRQSTLALASVLLLVPFAGAVDPFSPLVCDPALDGCTTVGVCVQDVLCQRHLCDPALDCRGDVATHATCAANQTIEGETCQTSAGASTDVGRATSLPPGASLRDNGVGASVTFTDGDARLRELPNAWFSHEARVTARAAGITLADTRIDAYRSVILLDPDEGPQAILFPESNHTFSQVGLSIRQKSDVLGDRDATVALVMLDNVPEGCFVRSSGHMVDDYRCPRVPRPLV